MIKSTKVNNRSVWINNRSSHDDCLRSVGYSNMLGLRSTNFCYVSNFVEELVNDFLLIIIVRMLELLIVVVEVIFRVILVEVTIMVRELIV